MHTLITHSMKSQIELGNDLRNEDILALIQDNLYLMRQLKTERKKRVQMEQKVLKQVERLVNKSS